jgi:hypothetical protein
MDQYKMAIFLNSLKNNRQKLYLKVKDIKSIIKIRIWNNLKFLTKHKILKIL